MSEQSVAFEARLFPLLRTTTYHDGLAVPLVRLPFAPLVFAHVAIESQESLRLLTPADAAVLGRTFAELLELAWARLARLDHPFAPHPDAPGVYRCAAADPFAAARLAMPGFLGSLAESFGPVVAAIPNAASLLVARRDDEAAVERLVDLAEAIWQGDDDPLSPVPYVAAEGGEAMALSLPPSHRLRDRLRRAHVAFITRTYAAQRASLLEAASRAGAEIEVAICGATTHPELGAVTSTRLVEGLVPVTDFIFVAWHDGEIDHALLVDRDDLRSIAPGRLVPAGDFDPPLEMVVGMPSADEIERLKAVALWTAR
jgi:hypothetical protein